MELIRVQIKPNISFKLHFLCAVTKDFQLLKSIYKSQYSLNVFKVKPCLWALTLSLIIKLSEVLSVTFKILNLWFIHWLSSIHASLFQR